MIVALTTEGSATLSQPVAAVHGHLVRLLNDTGGTLGTASDTYVEAAFRSAVKAWSVGSAFTKTADLPKRAEVHFGHASEGQTTVSITVRHTKKLALLETDVRIRQGLNELADRLVAGLVADRHSGRR